MNVLCLNYTVLCYSKAYTRPKPWIDYESIDEMLTLGSSFEHENPELDGVLFLLLVKDLSEDS
jgi:hypothetical protein